jgi:hypothetical protein
MRMQVGLANERFSECHANVRLGPRPPVLYELQRAVRHHGARIKDSMDSVAFVREQQVAELPSTPPPRPCGRACGGGSPARAGRAAPARFRGPSEHTSERAIAAAQYLDLLFPSAPCIRRKRASITFASSAKSRC